MNRYKININRTPPSSEDIASLRNFDEVLGKVPRPAKPIYKRLWLVTLAAASVIIALVGIAFYATQKENEKMAMQKPFINPPGIATNAEAYAINCNDSNTIITPNGVKIFIPKHSLIDYQGNPVNGKAFLSFHQYNDEADVLCSGIPLWCDSAGTRYYFDSKLLIDIGASANNMALQVSADKQIRVEIPSKMQSKLRHQYYLDTLNKNWVYKGNEELAPLATNTKAEKNQSSADKSPSNNTNTNQGYVMEGTNPKTTNSSIPTSASNDAAIAELKRRKPIAPVKAQPYKKYFNYSFALRDFPELTVYKNLLFDVGNENINFKKSYFDTSWANVQLEHGPKRGINYRLTLTKGALKIKLFVYPVIEAGSYDLAMQKYTGLMDAYEQQLAMLLAEKSKYNTATVRGNRNPEPPPSKALTNPKPIVNDDQADATEMCIITVSQMGVWKADYRHEVEHATTLEIHCTDTSNTALIPDGMVYLIDKTNHTCVGFNATKAGNDEASWPITWNPQTENMLVIFVQGKVAIVEAEAMHQYQTNPEKAMIKLPFKLHPEINNLNDLKKLLRMG